MLLNSIVKEKPPPPQTEANWVSTAKETQYKA
jgi:hypothetical protein